MQYKLGSCGVLTQPNVSEAFQNNFCNRSYDGVSCWPPTAVGELAIISCPKTGSIKFIGNASRFCLQNATWELKSNYSSCVAILPEDSEVSTHTKIVHIIYYIGFIVSSVALIMSLFIFRYFQSLHCLRNSVHCHLMATFLLRNLLWLILKHSIPFLLEDEVKLGFCKLLVSLSNYTQVTNFFWMLVEGINLYMMLMYALTTSTLQLWHYCLIGWGMPLVFSVSWIGVMMKFSTSTCWLPSKKEYFSYILNVPIFMVLLINIIILLKVVWILITKLKASNTIEINQVRKAAKATVILFPLLGITYILFLSHPPGQKVSLNIFKYVNAILSSTQGLAVSLFYCFFNGEVKTTIGQKLSRWKDENSFLKLKKNSAGNFQTCSETINLKNTERPRAVES